MPTTAASTLRKPFLVAAFVLLVLAVLGELGSAIWVGAGDARALPRPGIAIAYLALFDLMLGVTVLLFTLALVMPARLLGMVQGIASLIVYLLLLITALFAIFVALGKLILMVSLLLAVPFGTIAYFAAFADFDVGAARATLATIMSLKIGFAVCMVLAQQDFLKVKSLVLLILCSFLINVIVGFLQELPPGFLVSITDSIAAIIVAIVAAIWLLFKFIFTIPAVLKVLRVDRQLA